MNRHMKPTRRAFSLGLGMALATGASTRPCAVFAAVPADDALAAELARIEKTVAGRLGVAVRDTGTGRRRGHRLDERFPMCSTFKMLASAALLARVDKGVEDLGRRIRYSSADLVPYSPVTKEHVADGMTLAEICHAAITQSDNTAGNLILASLGGPAALTRYARSIGDPVTRLDRTEPTLNEAIPGDPRDTTTPAAMAANLEALALGDTLSPRSRDQLATWLVATETGDARLRAGIPKDWRVGDKTGTGNRGTANDIAVIWPPQRKPLTVSVYLTETKASLDDRNAAIAAVGRAVAAWLDG
jgi:beta-lactamase class A